MAKRYRDPKTIYSPKDAIKNVEVVFEDPDGVSIAKIKWYDEDVIGIRWNVALREWDDNEKMSGQKECLGMPISRAHPAWFILPKDLSDDQSEVSKALKNIKF
jgi:hypothetical protein